MLTGPKIAIESDRVLVNIHRLDNNIGDWMSSPLRFFSFPTKTAEVDILGGTSQVQLNHDVLVGGGGLLARDSFALRMESIAERTKGSLIGWGIGHNRYEAINTTLSYPDYLRRFKLLGLRDYGQGLPYVPCVSCMSPLFDQAAEIRHEAVVYRHGKRPWPLEIDPEIPVMENTAIDAGMDEAFRRTIDSLSSAEIILTNSYHGVYWGILLGKKVLAVPFSTKFYALKYKVPLVETEDWRAQVHEAKAYPEALEECRDLNRRFHAKVLAYLS
jgi:hypothetical protein